MKLKEHMQNGCIYAGIVATAVSPSLNNAVLKDQIHEELNKPHITYEKRIETPKHLQKEALADMSKSINEMAEKHFEAKEKHDKAEEMLERSNSPPYSYSDRPPPKNLDELQKEYSVNRQEIQSLKHRANQMEMRMKDISNNEAKISELKNNRQNSPNTEKQIKSLENSREKAHEFFKREYNVEPEKAAETIEKLRGQAAVRERELKQAEEKINNLKEQQKGQQERRATDSRTKENMAMSYARVY